MIGQIWTSTHGKITLQPSLPGHFRGVVLPGSSASSWEEPSGRIILQEYGAAQFTIAYYIFQFTERSTLITREEAYPFQSLACLRSHAGIHLNAAAKFQIRENQQAFFFDPQGERKFLFEKGTEYQFFSASFSEEFAQQFTPLFSLLQTPGVMPSGLSLLLRPSPMGVHMLDIIQNLLHCPFAGKLQQLYFENKVREYLFLVLARSQSGPGQPTRLSPIETKAVLETRRIILEDIEKHYTISELAKQVHLNEFKLKAGFRELFGKGMFEYLLDARMQKARSLLLETAYPIKHIASVTGYRRMTSFITAFRRHFGYTPGSLRRR
jgi:AraC family transcriptional activator of pyochelin receptor